MAYQYTPSGVCARRINFDLDGTKIRGVRFEGGCNGNAAGLASLIEGMDAGDAVRRLRGIRCGTRSTSCPDQLALAIERALETLGR